MKKVLLAVSVAVMAISVSCTKDYLNNNALPQEGFNVSILGEIGEFATTKSTAESCIRLKWENGDEVYAYGSNGSSIVVLGSLTVAVESDNAYVALMSGTLSSAPSDGKLYLVHCPLLTAAPEISGGAISISLASQPSTYVPFVAYATVTGVSATTQSSLRASFSFASSVIKANVYGITSNTTMLSATLSDVNTACKITFGGTISVAGETAGSISKTLGTSSSASGKASFYIAVPAITAASGRTLTVKTDDAWFAKTGAVTKAHEENAYVNTICDLTEATYEYDGSGYNGTCVFGTIWAPVNCGYNSTTAPEGLYYQWGKKQGFASSGFTTSSTQLDNMAAGITCTTFIAQSDYCWYEGATNDETWPTDKSYDPCPEGWRIPVIKELTDLVSNKSITDPEQHGIEYSTLSESDWRVWINGTGGISNDQSGYLFGNKVFFPCSGEIDRKDGTYSDSWPGYWTASHGYGTDASYITGRNMYFQKSTHTIYPTYCTYRGAGFTIRCVKE